MGSKGSGDRARGTSDDIRAVMDHLRRIVQALRISAGAAEKEAGVSGAQLFVLRSLDESSASSLRELASRTATDQSSVSVVVSRLVDRGLVRRVASKADARRIEISLTGAGRKRVRRSPKVAQSALVEALERTPRAARKTLAHALGELAREMSLEAEPQMFFEAAAPRKRGRRSDARR